MDVGEAQKSFFPASLDDFEARDYFYVNTEQKDVKAEDLVGKPKGKRQLLFERGCLESPTAKLTRPEAIKLLGNIWRKITENKRSPSWPSSYNVPDRASRTRRKRHRVRVGLFKDALQAKEPTKRIYEGCARLRRTLFFVLWISLTMCQSD